NSRRWASWFLEVADEQGGFFRTPLGYPALELVTEDLLERRAEQPAPIQPVALAPPGEGAGRARVAEIVREITARHAHTAQLLEVNRRLRDELRSVYERLRRSGLAPGKCFHSPERRAAVIDRLAQADRGGCGSRVPRADAPRAAHNGDRRSQPAAERRPDPLPSRPHPNLRPRGTRGHFV